MDWVGRALTQTVLTKSTANTANSPTPHPIGSVGSEIVTADFATKQTAALIAEARSVGLELPAEGVGGLRVRHRTNAAPDEMLIARLADNKLAVIEELRRESDVIQYAAVRGLYDAEWRVAGCLAFTALERADEAAEAGYGACLSCGASIELHGSPDASKWRRVATLDNVEIATVRYVLASAGAIARGWATNGHG